MAINRRRLIQTAAAASSLAVFPQLKLAAKTDSKRQRVVVIGGGFAGATAAKYLKMVGARSGCADDRKKQLFCVLSAEQYGVERQPHAAATDT